MLPRVQRRSFVQESVIPIRRLQIHPASIKPMLLAVALAVDCALLSYVQMWRPAVRLAQGRPEQSRGTASAGQRPHWPPGATVRVWIDTRSAPPYGTSL